MFNDINEIFVFIAKMTDKITLDLDSFGEHF